MVIRNGIVHLLSALALVLAAAAGAGCLLDATATDLETSDVAASVSQAETEQDNTFCCSGDPCDTHGNAPICEPWLVISDPAAHGE